MAVVDPQRSKMQEATWQEARTGDAQLKAPDNLLGNAKADGRAMEKDDATDASRAVTPQELQQQSHHDQHNQHQQQKHEREDPPLPLSGTTSSAGSTSPTKKRRKVNHGTSSSYNPHPPKCDGPADRPCARCVKRNIGHLCHDEPREHAKSAKIQSESLDEGNNAALRPDELAADTLLPSIDQQPASQQLLQETDLDLGSQPVPTNGQTTSAQLADSSPTSRAPKVTNEYNLLNDFLSTSLLDDDNMFSNDDAQALYPGSSLGSNIAAGTNGHGGQRSSTQAFRFPGPSQAGMTAWGDTIRPPSVMSTDKAREYYMTAADPAGSDTPEERMEKLLRAKYDAGMLRPFNYVKGYARLNQYMDEHMQPTSRQKILRGLDRFRPKFRERMQTLTDMQLVRVEMWFERSLMEYDRVFASMAIPACCWRRTGEIFRGNREMAELIHVPIEQLRDVCS
ncbi:MAG: hypothetical protein Q9213_003384 [Squamulea squamosa]